MKKILFSALVATVAIGGALASHANSNRVLTQFRTPDVGSGPCNLIDCSVGNPGALCSTIDVFSDLCSTPATPDADTRILVL